MPLFANEKAASDFLAQRRSGNNLAQVAPLTSQATNTQKVQFSAPTGPMPLPPVANRDEAYLQQNQAKDEAGNPIEFDYKNGIPLGIYMRVAMATDDQSKFDLLSKFYNGKVRRDTGGVPIVRTEENGKPKDVLVNPLGADFTDFTDVLGQAIIPTLGAIAMARRGGKTPPIIAEEVGGLGQRFMGWLKKAAGMSAAAEGAGAVQDVVERTAEGIPVRPGDIAASRAGNVALDMGLGAAGTVLGKAVGKVRAPFGGSVKQSNLDAKEASVALTQEAYNEGQILDLVLTPAELTGSKVLGRTETFAKVHPGASGAFEDIQRRNSESFQTIENMLLGVPGESTLAQRAASIPSAQQTGEALAGSIERNVIDRTESELSTATRTAVAASERGLGSSILASGSIPPVGTKQEVGEGLRAGLTRLRDAEKRAASDQYKDLLSDPRVQEFSLPGDTLQKDLAPLVDELPQVQHKITSESELLDQLGKPVTVTERNVKIQKPYLPDGILQRFDGIMSLAEPTYRLNDLIKMRTEVTDAIAIGKSVADVDTHFLAGLHDRLTTAIRDGLKGIDPKLLAKWESGNEAYAKFAQKFQQSAITPAFLVPEQASFQGGESLVEHFTKGTRGAENFRRLRETMGATSPEFAALKGDVMRDVLAAARSPYKGHIDAKRLLDGMDAMAKDSPEVFKEVFGKNGQAIADFARELGAVRGDLPEDVVRQVLENPKKSVMAIRTLVQTQKDAVKLYNNEIIKKVRNGTLNPGSLNAEELVSNFQVASLPHIKEVIGFLQRDPAVLRAVQQKEMERLLHTAALEKGVAGTAIGEVNYSQKSLLTALGSKDNRRKLEAIMGPKKIKTIETMAAFLGANGYDPTFAVGGGISAGIQTGQAVRGEFKKYGIMWAKSMVFSKVLLSDTLRNWVTKEPMSNAKANTILTGFLAMTPLIRELIEAVGDSTAIQAMREVKQGVDQRFPAASQSGPRMNAQDAAEFLRQRRQQQPRP